MITIKGTKGKRSSQKVRRNSGRDTPSCLIKDKKYVIEHCLEPQVFWNDWNDYRDGQRDAGYSDRTLLCNDYIADESWEWMGHSKKKNKIKILKLLKRRENAKLKKNRYT